MKSVRNSIYLQGSLDVKSFCIILAFFAWLPANLIAAQFTVETFCPWTDYNMLNGLWFSGDFNGDGKADILHAVEDEDYVHVWMSNGDGSYYIHSFSPWPDYAIPNGLWYTGDFNGDDTTDILHAVENSNYVHIWISNGNGTFSVHTFSPFSGYAIPNGLWYIGDFDGDGSDDIVHPVPNTNYAHTWISNGDGSFTLATFSPFPEYAIPNGLWYTGDFNGDSKTDILHAVENTDYVHIWISNGNGTFFVHTFSPWPGYTIPNGLWHIGDFDGDGSDDIVHPVPNTNYVQIWISQGGSNFTISSFSPWPGYKMPNGLWFIDDFNGDGMADIFHAVENTDYVHVWVASGNGAFSVGSFSPRTGYPISNGLWLPGDFTGDGKSDIVHIIDNTDYVHPWTSTLPGQGEISIDGIEITQAIQDMNHSVPLIAEKLTVVRVYLSYQSTHPITVRGELTAIRPGIPDQTIYSYNTMSINPGDNFNLQFKREDIDRSLNFDLPTDLTTAGELTVQVSSIIDRITGSEYSCSDCPSSKRIVHFQQAAPQRVHVVGFYYDAGSPLMTFAPRLIDYSLLESWLRRAYPISQLEFTSVTARLFPWRDLCNCNLVNALLSVMRLIDIDEGTRDFRTHYYGMVPNADTLMIGCASGIPSNADPTIVASGPTGPPTPTLWSWDTDATFGDWYGAHELGHTYGRLHPGSGCRDESSDDSNYPFPNGHLSGANGEFVGFDIGDILHNLPTTALPGTMWHDVMTYCDFQWISSYTYIGIMDRLAAENQLTPPASPSVAGSSSPHSGQDSPIKKEDVLEKTDPSLANPPKVEIEHLEQPDFPEDLKAISPPIIFSEAEADLKPIPKYEKAPDIVNYRETPSLINLGISEPVTPKPSAPPGPLQARIAEGDFLSIIATINITQNTGEILFVNRVAKAMISESEQKDQVTIRLVDDAKNVLDEYRVWVRADTDIPEEEDQTGLVHAVIPYRTGISTVEIIRSGNLIDVLKVSRNAPVINSINIPKFTSKKDMLSVPIKLSWAGLDYDDDPLIYNVLISNDNGVTWEIIAVGLKDPYLSFPSEQLIEFKQVIFKVMASDGFHSTEFKSEQLVIPEN